jgi:hypothetical protein
MLAVMDTPPPILVLLDLSAILAGTSREWPGYARVGKCFLPQVVYEEIEFLCKRASEPSQEKTARDFMRFYSNSGWQLTSADANHLSVTVPAGKDMSKQARLTVATVRCAYGLSKEQERKLVVFVGNGHSLLQKIQALRASNLCGITATQLLQWGRMRQRPEAVTEHMQAMMRAGAESVLTGQLQGMVHASPTTARPTTRTRTSVQQSQAVQRSYTRSPSLKASSPSGGFLKQISGLLTVGAIAIAGLFVWQTVQPASFKKTWKQLGLPTLSGHTPAPPKKPLKK